MSLVKPFKKAAEAVNNAANAVNTHVIKSGVAFTVPNLFAEISYGLSSGHNDNIARYIVLSAAVSAALASACKMKRVSLSLVIIAGMATAASGMAVEDTLKEIFQDFDQWQEALKKYDWRDSIPGEAAAGAAFVWGAVEKWAGRNVRAAFAYATSAPALYWAATQDVASGTEINPYLAVSAGLFLWSAVFLPFMEDPGKKKTSDLSPQNNSSQSPHPTNTFRPYRIRM